MKEKEYWIWLSLIPNLKSRDILNLLEYFKTVQNIEGATAYTLSKIVSNEIAENIVNQKYKSIVPKYFDYMIKSDIDIMTILDSDYPKKLKSIYNPPAYLYIKGDRKVLNTNAIAIVGCRICSDYGRIISKKIAYELARENINIVSGLAKGIDAFSHIGAIEAGGITIAVIGSGIDIPYPNENRNIYYKILQTGGAIISEYVMGTKPLKMNFPERNRIISGISNGVVVVEAKQKSGSMITVDFALEQGKEIFAVPGNISSQNSEGTNRLIKEGAKLVTCIEDIKEEFKIYQL